MLRSPSPRQQLEQVRREIREHLSHGRLAEAFPLWERILDMGADAETYEELLSPLDRWAMSGRSVELYAFLEALKADPSREYDAWRRNLCFTLLDRLDWKGEALIASSALKEVPERYAWMRAN